MFCKNCGKPLPDDAHFCLACGASIVTNTSLKKVQQKKSGTDVSNYTAILVVSSIAFTIITVVLIIGVILLIRNLQLNNRSLQSKIIGTWQSNLRSDPFIYTFEADGDLVITNTDEDTTHVDKYWLDDDNTFNWLFYDTNEIFRYEYSERAKFLRSGDDMDSWYFEGDNLYFGTRKLYRQ